MAENNFTVWQRLTKVFGPDSTLDQQPPVYNFDKKELLKTRDKEEFEREKLQAQQTLYLGQQWQKVENNLYTQAGWPPFTIMKVWSLLLKYPRHLISTLRSLQLQMKMVLYYKSILRVTE